MDSHACTSPAVRFKTALLHRGERRVAVVTVVIEGPSAHVEVVHGNLLGATRDRRLARTVAEPTAARVITGAPAEPTIFACRNLDPEGGI